MNIYDYLCAELETVNNELFKPFHNMETCNHCRYWQGYADALTNALNELAGPGDVN